ncbi:tetratricopeptide repeat protein [Hymenobacter sp. BT683]|uniref:Tetratricopeptide repeat protein n=1 Tax=Hymenobacter jeongseonensis TaxID=2791027 RepID=A0ABS0ILT2_9BACT|nr:tetratricopeptide repeat protein [Hymenobacter jeongseonensis]MBF9238984.1 tetratricopeptide repeat protein [Hymenobacter jeongseonensis]
MRKPLLKWHRVAVRALFIFAGGVVLLAAPARLAAAVSSQPTALAAVPPPQSSLWHSQQHRIDSIKALIENHSDFDSTRVVLLTNLAWEVKLQNVKAARPILEEALSLARRLRYKDLVAETLLDLADYHITLAEYGPAVRLLNESRDEFKKVHDQGGEVRCHGRLAQVADQQGQYAASLAHCFQGLALPTNTNTRRFQTNLKIQVGNTFTKLGDYAHARDYLFDALQVARRYDYPDRINLALGGLGDVAKSQKKWAEARHYYVQSMAVSQKLHNASEVLTMQLNLAEVSERQGDFAQSFALASAALRQSILAGQRVAIPRAQGILARAFLRQGQSDSAIIYGERSLQASKLVRAVEGSRAANEVLALAYAKEKDFARAYQASIGRKAFNDSLLNESTVRRTAALQLNFELGQQQAQIKLLTQQSRLQAQERELDKLRQQRQLLGLSGLGVLAIGFAGYLLWRFRQRQSARESALRTLLAADLRDDVGALLRQISLQSNLLQEGLADAAGQRLQISRLSEASRTAVRQLNDVVWSLDTQQDYLAELLNRMREYAHELLCSRGIEVVLEAPEVAATVRLHTRLRRNLYLIYKESLQHILKHAIHATQVIIRIRLEGPQLIIDVIDNGQSVPAGGQAGLDLRAGQGLAHIDARANAIGGAATTGPVLAADGTRTGFGVRIAVPLPTI